MRDIIHLNFIGFAASVASSLDKSLKNRPFVISGVNGGRKSVFDASGEAIKGGVIPGMALSLAEKKVPGLLSLASDPSSLTKYSLAIEEVISKYAPSYQSDYRGNWYLDVTGTSSLFGPPSDCASRVIKEILEKTGLCPAASAASNKLVGKVATRAIRPLGLIRVRGGDEASFLSRQDIRLLPGIGPSLLKTVSATGFREIGELALLDDSKALSLFGKKGLALRDAARGVDSSGILCGPIESNKEAGIKKRLEFEEDVIDYEIIRGALLYLCESCGFDMRKDSLGSASIGLSIMYADGVIERGEERRKGLLVLDREIRGAVEKLYLRIAKRRVRIRLLSLSLLDLRPLGWSPDLFIPEEDEKERKAQEAADKIRNRFGINKATKALVLASSKRGISRLPSPNEEYAY